MSLHSAGSQSAVSANRLFNVGPSSSASFYSSEAGVTSDGRVFFGSAPSDVRRFSPASLRGEVGNVAFREDVEDFGIATKQPSLRSLCVDATGSSSLLSLSGGDAASAVPRMTRQVGEGNVGSGGLPFTNDIPEAPVRRAACSSRFVASQGRGRLYNPEGDAVPPPLPEAKGEEANPLLRSDVDATDCLVRVQDVSQLQNAGKEAPASSSTSLKPHYLIDSHASNAFVGALLGFCSAEEMLDKQQVSTASDFERLDAVVPGDPEARIVSRLGVSAFLSVGINTTLNKNSIETERGDGEPTLSPLLVKYICAQVNPYLAFSSFRRSDAGKPFKPETTRPALWCRRTVHALLTYCVDADLTNGISRGGAEALPPKPYLYPREKRYCFLDVYNFVRDRLRACWQDLTVQHVSKHRAAIECLEISFRFLVLSEELLAGEDGFDPVSNHGLLQTCLDKLMQGYEAVRGFLQRRDASSLRERDCKLFDVLVFASPYEGEFWAYKLLMLLGTEANEQSVVSLLQRLPPQLQTDPSLRFALKALRAFRSQSLTRYVALMRNGPYLPCLLLHKFLPFARARFLAGLVHGRLAGSRRNPLTKTRMLRLLGFDGEPEQLFQRFLEVYGVGHSVSPRGAEICVLEKASKAQLADLSSFKKARGPHLPSNFLKLPVGITRQQLLDPDFPMEAKDAASALASETRPSAAQMSRRFLQKKSASPLAQPSASQKPEAASARRSDLSNVQAFLACASSTSNRTVPPLSSVASPEASRSDSLHLPVSLSHANQQTALSASFSFQRSAECKTVSDTSGTAQSELAFCGTFGTKPVECFRSQSPREEATEGASLCGVQTPQARDNSHAPEEHLSATGAVSEVSESNRASLFSFQEKEHAVVPAPSVLPSIAGVEGQMLFGAEPGRESEDPQVASLRSKSLDESAKDFPLTLCEEAEDAGAEGRSVKNTQENAAFDQVAQELMERTDDAVVKDLDTDEHDGVLGASLFIGLSKWNSAFLESKGRTQQLSVQEIEDRPRDDDGRDNNTGRAAKEELESEKENQHVTVAASALPDSRPSQLKEATQETVKDVALLQISEEGKKRQTSSDSETRPANASFEGNCEVSGRGRSEDVPLLQKEAMGTPPSEEDSLSGVFFGTQTQIPAFPLSAVLLDALSSGAFVLSEEDAGSFRLKLRSSASPATAKSRTAQVALRVCFLGLFWKNVFLFCAAASKATSLIRELLLRVAGVNVDSDSSSSCKFEGLVLRASGSECRGSAFLYSRQVAMVPCEVEGSDSLQSLPLPLFCGLHLVEKERGSAEERRRQSAVFRFEDYQVVRDAAGIFLVAPNPIALKRPFEEAGLSEVYFLGEEDPGFSWKCLLAQLKAIFEEARNASEMHAVISVLYGIAVPRHLLELVSSGCVNSEEQISWHLRINRSVEELVHSATVSLRQQLLRSLQSSLPNQGEAFSKSLSSLRVRCVALFPTKEKCVAEGPEAVGLCLDSLQVVCPYTRGLWGVFVEDCWEALRRGTERNAPFVRISERPVAIRPDQVLCFLRKRERSASLLRLRQRALLEASLRICENWTSASTFADEKRNDAGSGREEGMDRPEIHDTNEPVEAQLISEDVLLSRALAFVEKRLMQGDLLSSCSPEVPPVEWRRSSLALEKTEEERAALRGFLPSDGCWLSPSLRHTTDSPSFSPEEIKAAFRRAASALRSSSSSSSFSSEWPLQTILVPRAFLRSLRIDWTDREVESNGAERLGERAETDFESKKRLSLSTIPKVPTTSALPALATLSRAPASSSEDRESAEHSASLRRQQLGHLAAKCLRRAREESEALRCVLAKLKRTKTGGGFPESGGRDGYSQVAMCSADLT